jgi:hypothetical protein
VKTLLEQLGIAWLGLTATLLVVGIEVTVLRWIGLSLIGTVFYYIIPVGAVVGGGLAASGYYLGARYTHSRASPSLLVLMVLIAGLAYFLIYWFDYTYSGARNSYTFWDFVNYRLTHTTLFGRHFLRGVELGALGYVSAFIEFIGFLFGGVVVYGLLSNEKMCPSCNLYFSSLMTRVKNFTDAKSMASYVNSFRDVVAGPETSFNSIDSTALASLKPISTKVTLELLGCPICKRQVLEQKVAVSDGENWKDIDSLARWFELRPGVDLRSRID